MKLTNDQKQKVTAIAIGCVAGVFVIYYLLISSAQASLAKLRTDAEAANSKANQAKELVDKASVVEANLIEIEQQIGAIEDTMPSGDLYAWVQGMLNTMLTRHSRVSIPRTTRPAEADVGLLPRFPYRAAIFNVEGTAYYHDLGNFIADFENLFPHMRLQNMVIMAQAAAAGERRTEATSGASEKLQFRMDLVALIKPSPSR